ncbi:MAG: class I SAM-dependent methyltransferase [Alphaproteobacteria bacterium]
MPVSADFWEGIGRQLRCPTGRAGWLIGHLMSLINKQPNQLAIEALAVSPSDTILELGFGSGRSIKALTALASRGEVLGIDQSPEMLTLASRANQRAIGAGRVALRLGRFDALPWPSETVDKILAVNVAYFFGTTGDEFREVRRVLRPGGMIAIYATDRSTMAKWKFAGLETHSHIDEATLRAMAVCGGFDPVEVSVKTVSLPFGINGILAILCKRKAVEPHYHRMTSAWINVATSLATPLSHEDRSGQYQLLLK